MAKVKISDLDAAAALDGTELVEVTQDGASVRTTTQDIADLGGASYLKYVALLTQTGTDAPVATVLENTLGGTVVWTYDSVANYIGTLPGAFTSGKTWVAKPAPDFAVSNAINGDFEIISADAVKIFFDAELEGVAHIEIRVYP